MTIVPIPVSDYQPMGVMQTHLFVCVIFVFACHISYKM